jgi:hypothetical protein
MGSHPAKDVKIRGIFYAQVVSKANSGAKAVKSSPAKVSEPVEAEQLSFEE